MENSKRSFMEFANINTKFHTPIFDRDWNPLASQRDNVQRLLVFLEDKPVLYMDFDKKANDYVELSIHDIQCELTKTLDGLSWPTAIGNPVKAMLDACSKFHDTAQNLHHPTRHHRAKEIDIYAIMEKLRSEMGHHLARLCISYGIDVPEILAQIFPVSDNAIGEKGES